MGKKKTLDHPSLCISHDGQYTYILMLGMYVDGASILTLNCPIREAVSKTYAACVEAPIEIAGANKCLWYWRKEKLNNLVLPVLNYIESGSWNNQVRDTLLKIIEIEKWDNLKERIQSLPDRHSLGSAESWSLAALNLYGKEMIIWWQELSALRRRAAIWYLTSRGLPVVAEADPAIRMP